MEKQWQAGIAHFEEQYLSLLPGWTAGYLGTRAPNTNNEGRCKEVNKLLPKQDISPFTVLDHLQQKVVPYFIGLNKMMMILPRLESNIKTLLVQPVEQLFIQ